MREKIAKKFLRIDQIFELLDKFALFLSVIILNFSKPDSGSQDIKIPF